MANPFAWETRIADGLVDAGTQLAHEETLLGDWAARERRPLALLWRSAPALIVSQRERHLSGFDAAAREAAREGWPVYVRKSGGAAVALAPGVVNVALLASFAGAAPSLEAGFMLLCRPIIAALAQFSVTATTGGARGAVCNGRFNLLVGERKIAGTAQRRTRQGAHHVLLAHATVLVEADRDLLTGVVANFYRRAGSAMKLSADALISLDAALPTSRSGDLPAQFAATLSEVLCAAQY